jgi:hypothetical protein
MKLTKTGLTSAAKAVGRVVVAAANKDPLLVDQLTKQKRLDLCMICDNNVAMQCQLCECLVRAKTMLTTEFCPENKW